MVILKHKDILKICFSYAFAITFMIMIGAVTSQTSAYTCKPGDIECEEAKVNMKESLNTATEYTNKANSVSEIISQLEGEIKNLNKTIADNEARVKELNAEIKETEAKLAENQAALAEMLISMHFSGDNEPITILAGSRTISDYAEKQAREEVAKQEIAAASERVKEIKEKLNAQKEEAEATLAKNEQSRLALAGKKETQNALKKEYENNADEATVAAAYWEEKVKAMSWTPPANASGSGSRWSGAGNSYPYRNVCGPDFDYSLEGNWIFPYGGLICQCTDYVSYKANDTFGITNTWYGDAWAYAYASGYYVPYNKTYTYVNSIPSANSIAVWPADYPGATGHVAWVESVNSDGTINVSEYNVNWPAAGCYEMDFCARSNVGTTNVTFLHFEPM